MDNHKLSIHLKAFNDKVKVMNQTNNREIVLSSIEAKNLHNDIFSLLATIAELTQKLTDAEKSQEVINLEFNGGQF